MGEGRTAARAVETLLRREAGAQEIAQILTGREIEIVRLAAHGLANKEIAKALSVAEATARPACTTSPRSCTVRAAWNWSSTAKRKGQSRPG